MPLTQLQSAVLRVIARNRSMASYVAGGAVLNRTSPRVSEDIDIFHDVDEQVHGQAQRDIAVLRDAGFLVRIVVETFGLTEVAVGRYGEETLLQWMSESRLRYFPVEVDPDFGFRLHDADLAVNKVLAAAQRRVPRDAVDLVWLNRNYAPLGPLVWAAAGKAFGLGPGLTIEEIRRHALSHSVDEIATIKTNEPFEPAKLRADIVRACNEAADYCGTAAPVEHPGKLFVDRQQRPVAATPDMLADGSVIAVALSDGGAWPVIPGATDMPGPPSAGDLPGH